MRLAAYSLVVLSLLGVACTQKEAPVAAASGEQSGFAERYPARLNGTRQHFASDENQARTTLGEFKGYPDALKNPDWSAVRTVVEQADSTGKSSAYTEAALESETVARFMDEEKDGLRQKVGGAVSYASGQKKCPEDLGGAAISAMERGVDKQLEERLRNHSEAHRYIDDHEDELGKPNVETLKKQTDKIARTSNIAYVRLELYRREVEALLNDASSVRSTLDRTIQESDATLANASASKTKKAAAQRHKTAAQNARTALDAEVEQNQRGLEEMQKRVGTLQNDYRAALDALLADLKTRAEAKK
ncbi:MAG: hypothetical protein QM756_15130 [Polyangiaceae bacterium]